VAGLPIPSADVIDKAAARTLVWDGCVNVRELGGIPTADGGMTRTGSVIRSDNVAGLTPAGWRALEDHGIDRIVDLRWPEETADDPPRSVDIEVVRVSVLGPMLGEGHAFVRSLNEHVDTVEDPADHFAWSYVEFLERHREEFGQALAAIAAAPGPVVIHCMGGKDRTGLVAALLLRVAGVGLEEIGRDFSLSGPNLAASRQHWLDSAPSEAERRRREKLSQTPATAMVRVIAEIEQRYGSVEGYLEAAGLEPGQIERLRARLR